jgi:hypothetical protein
VKSPEEALRGFARLAILALAAAAPSLARAQDASKADPALVKRVRALYDELGKIDAIQDPLLQPAKYERFVAEVDGASLPAATKDVLDSHALYNEACACAVSGKRSAALKAFSRSIQRGFNDWSQIAQDHDLDSIRDDAAFKKAVAQGQARDQKAARERDANAGAFDDLELTQVDHERGLTLTVHVKSSGVAAVERSYDTRPGVDPTETCAAPLHGDVEATPEELSAIRADLAKIRLETWEQPDADHAANPGLSLSITSGGQTTSRAADIYWFDRYTETGRERWQEAVAEQNRPVRRQPDYKPDLFERAMNSLLKIPPPLPVDQPLPIQGDDPDDPALWKQIDKEVAFKDLQWILNGIAARSPDPSKPAWTKINFDLFPAHPSTGWEKFVTITADGAVTVTDRGPDKKDVQTTGQLTDGERRSIQALFDQANQDPKKFWRQDLDVACKDLRERCFDYPGKGGVSENDSHGNRQSMTLDLDKADQAPLWKLVDQISERVKGDRLSCTPAGDPPAPAPTPGVSGALLRTEPDTGVARSPNVR